jgi:hypothetical protein
MNYYPNQDRDLHCRRSAIDLPYPGSPSPPRSNISASQYRAPELHRAESIASYRSHQSRQERERYNQRPITPPADLPTPPMSRQGSFDLNAQLYSVPVPQQQYHYDPKDYPEHDDGSINFTPPSSADTTFNDQNPPPDNARPNRGGTKAYTERIPNPLIGYLNKVIRDSSDSGFEGVEYYDPQGRLTDANGTVIVNEPVKVPHDSKDRNYEHDDETDRRYRQQVNTTDAPSINHYPESFFLKDRYARATQNDGDRTPRQGSPVSLRTKSPNDRDTGQSHIDTLRKNYGLDPRPEHHVQEDRDTRYDPSISHATIKYAKRDRVSNLKPPKQPEHDSTRSYKRDLSPAQSISSLRSRYSAHSQHAKDPHRAPRTHKQESSESSRRSLSPVKRDRGQKYQSTVGRDRSLSPSKGYQVHIHGSERSRRSISPPRKDRNRRDIQTRSPDFSSSGSETDYSTPRRSKSGDSKVIMMMFSPKSQKSRSRNSNDSWDKKTYSGPSPVEQTFAPATLLRRQEAMSAATQKSRVARLLRSFADSLQGEGTAGGTRVSVAGLEG